MADGWWFFGGNPQPATAHPDAVQFQQFYEAYCSKFGPTRGALEASLADCSYLGFGRCHWLPVLRTLSQTNNGDQANNSLNPNNPPLRRKLEVICPIPKPRNRELTEGETEVNILLRAARGM